jgi:hypothetical protein
MMLFAPRAAYDAGPFVTAHVWCVGRLMLTIASAAPNRLFSTIEPGVTVWILSNTRNGSGAPFKRNREHAIPIVHHIDLLACRPTRGRR